MVNRVIRSALVIGLLAAPQLAAPAAAQPKNHIGEQLANIMIAEGCEMKQQDAGDKMLADGFHISDAQAQMTALHRGGYLTSNDGGETLRLVDWPPCN